MTATLADIKQEWRSFRGDPPGTRFQNHRERMQRRSRTHLIVATALGVLLLAIGVVLLFMPGPGLLLIVFGLGLVGSHSARVSHALDRTELGTRKRGRQLARWWRARSRAQHAALIGAAALVATAGLAAMWRFVVAAYVL